MMRTKFSWLLILFLGGALALASPVRAQISPLTYELRLGASVPVGPMSESDGSWAGTLGEDYSFGMDFAYAFRWFVAAYAGFSQHRFACPASGCGRSTDLTATGFDGGLRWILGSGRVIPVIRTGAVTYRMEGIAPDGSSGTRRVTSRRSVGAEGGVGLSVRLTRRVVVSPGVRYLWMDMRFPDLGTIPVQSVVADIGFMLAF